MAAFPGILQSPFVVATDRAIGRSQVGSLTAIDVAVDASAGTDPPPPPNAAPVEGKCYLVTKGPDLKEWCKLVCSIQGKDVGSCNWVAGGPAGCIGKVQCKDRERSDDTIQIETPS
jgi:hypothetical protein